MSRTSFRSTLSSGTAAALLEAEKAAGKHGTFEALDAFLASALRQAASRAPVVVPDWGQGTTATIRLEGLSPDDRALVERDYQLEVQEGRGAWFLQKRDTVKFGWANYPAIEATGVRFPVNSARDQSAKVSFQDEPDALATWALVAPMFADLLAPLDARTATGKAMTGAQQEARWSRMTDTYEDLGLDVGALVVPIRSGSHWVELDTTEQRNVQADLVAAVLEQTSDETARRWRARQVRHLVQAFDRKAKRGTPLARQVLTKAVQPLLSGLFGGSWPAFLNYLGEHPNETEEVVTSLPVPNLFIGEGGQTDRVARAQGLPVDEVERMLAAYLGATAGASPVEERTSAMREVWSIFDVLHSRQEPGMPSLWFLFVDIVTTMQEDYAADGYAAGMSVPAHLDAEVKRLWDGTTLPRWPERIVSEFHPYTRMSKAFGPALNFWNGVSLTCWYICEGSISRTAIAELEEYHRRDLKALEEIGCPIPEVMFEQLSAAETRLGPVEEVTHNRGSSTGDISISLQTEAGTRRDGYEILRDLVSAHRHAWAQRYLDEYLRARWESDVRAVALEFHRRLAARGKPPTIKQFASFAAETANNWFGGDLSAVFASFGETSPIRTNRTDLLDHEPEVFVANMVEKLTATWNFLPVQRDVYSEWGPKHWELRRLAVHALKYLQIQEALGRPPTPKEFGAGRYSWEYFGGQETGWESYAFEIERLRRTSGSDRSHSEPSHPKLPPSPHLAGSTPASIPPVDLTSIPEVQGWVADPPQAAPGPTSDKKPGLLGRFRRA